MSQEPLESENFAMPKYKSCDKCSHKGVCGAYNAFQPLRESFVGKYPYVTEFPAKPIALAMLCQEYKETELGENAKEYKSSGCDLGV